MDEKPNSVDSWLGIMIASLAMIIWTIVKLPFELIAAIFSGPKSPEQPQPPAPPSPTTKD